MHRTLIIARMNPHDASAVAEIFGESDRTELPGLIGVRRRTLFRFHGLYGHLIEADEDIGPRLAKNRGHQLFTDVTHRLGGLIRPYDPAWSQPRDAMATPFYTWEAH